MLVWRLRLFYTSYFLVLGVMQPYWPLWFAYKGMDAAAIAWLSALPSLVRMVSVPAIGVLADRLGERKRVVLALNLLALLAYLGFIWSDSFWAILLVSLPYGAMWAGILPLGDNLAVTASYRDKLDFGRIRLWGSIAYICAAALAGWFLAGRSAGLVYWLLLGTSLMLAAGSFALPDIRTAPAARSGGPAPWRKLLGAPLFVLFLFGQGCAQASHAMYYVFGSLYWRGIGHSEAVIGILWGEGVAVEVVVFAFGARLLARVGPQGLLLIGAAAGLVRWTGLAFATEIWELSLLQALHGLTFGAAFLGAMHFMGRFVRPEASATAQAVYSAVSQGLGLGLGFIAIGPLYAAYAGHAYLAMTTLSAIGTVSAFVLLRRWGDRVVG